MSFKYCAKISLLVKLIDLTNAYGILANGGKRIQPNFIQSIYNRKGQLVFKSSNKNCNDCLIENFEKKINIPSISDNKEFVIDSRIAYQITSMMEGVVQRGTAIKLKDLGFPIAGKIFFIA